MPWIAFALLLGGLLQSPPPPQATPEIAARCEVAQSIIAGQLDGREKPVIIVSSEGFGSSKMSVADFMRGWIRDDKPPRALAATFLAKPNVDLLTACPDLPSALARDGVAFGEAEMNA